jgi:hypothetical protein
LIIFFLSYLSLLLTAKFDTLANSKFRCIGVFFGVYFFTLTIINQFFFFFFFIFGWGLYSFFILFFVYFCLFSTIISPILYYYFRHYFYLFSTIIFAYSLPLFSPPLLLSVEWLQSENEALWSYQIASGRLSKVVRRVRNYLNLNFRKVWIYTGGANWRFL